MLVIDAAVARVYDLTIVREAGGLAPRLGVLCQSNDNVNTPRLFLDRVVIDAQVDVQFDTRVMHLNLCNLNAKRTTLRAAIAQSERYLLFATSGGSATFDRSRFIGGGGLAVVDATITVTNSILDHLAGSAAEGALLVGVGSISIAYSTIYESPLTCQMGASPACASAAREGVCIENSIVFQPSASTNSVSGDKCRFDYSMITPQQTAVIGGNNGLGATLNLKDAPNGDFHLVSGSDAIDAAHPSFVGTPDYDGISRPQGPRSDIGAFEYQ